MRHFMLMCGLTWAALQGACQGPKGSRERAGIPAAAQSAERLVGMTVETHSEVQQVQAGHEVLISCLARHGEQPAWGVPLTTDIEPASPLRARDSFTAVYTPAVVGSYRIVCRAASAASRGAPPRDPIGVNIEVTPAPAAHLVAVAAQRVVEAGEVYTVGCTAQDIFGNKAPAPAGTQVFADPSVQSAAGGRARSEQAGPAHFSCRAPGFADSPDLVVHVEATHIRSVEVQLAQGTMRAGEQAPGGCVGFDQYGNERTSAATLHYTHDTRPAAPARKALGAQAPSLTVAGTYTLYCDGDAQGVTYPAASLRVLPGLPKRWSADAGWKHDAGCYAQHQFYNLSGSVLDAYDNVVDHPKLEISAWPNLGAQLGPRGASFAEPGIYTLRASVAGEQAPDASLSALMSKPVEVNSTPPRVVVQYPERSARLEHAADTADRGVEVRGYVEDVAGLVALKVLGIPQQIAPHATRHAFKVMHTHPAWGLNLVQIEATNRCGVTTRHVQTYLRGERFVDTSVAGAPQGPSGTKIQLGPDMLRNSSPQLDSVADIIEKAMVTPALSERIGTLLAASYPVDEEPEPSVRRGSRLGLRQSFATDWDVLRTGPFSYKNASITRLEVEQDKLSVGLAFSDINIPVSVRVLFNGALVGNAVKTVAAHVTAGSINLRVALRGDAGRMRADLSDVSVEIGNGPYLVLDEHSPLALPVVKSVIKNVVSSFARFHRRSIEARMASQMHDGVVRGLAHAFESLAWQHPLVLPPPFAGSVLVTRTGEQVAFHGGTAAAAPHVGVSLTGVISPAWLPTELPEALRTYWRPEQRRWETAPGTLRHSEAVPDYTPLPHDKAFGVLVPDDLVNEFLWATWASGAFNVPHLADYFVDRQARRRDQVTVPAQAAAVSDLFDSRIALYATQPPVMMPSPQQNHVKVGWGDVFIDAEVYTLPRDPSGPDARVPVRIRLFATAILDAHVQIDTEETAAAPAHSTDRLSLDISAPDAVQLHLQTVFIGGTPHGGLMEKSSTLLEGWIKSRLPDLLSSTIREMPLPSIRIGKFAANEDNSQWRLHRAALQRPEHASYTILQGGVQMEEGQRESQ